jgi:hypothetical protein
VVGVVIAVASLLFSGWQARLLSRQTALQNATAGAATIQELFNWLHDVQGRLLTEPRLLPYFHPGEQEPLSHAEEAQMRLIAAMYCDVLNIGLFFQRIVPQTRSRGEWQDFCIRMLNERPVLREETLAKTSGYPELARLLPHVIKTENTATS